MLAKVIYVLIFIDRRKMRREGNKFMTNLKDNVADLDVPLLESIFLPVFSEKHLYIKDSF